MSTISEISTGSLTEGLPTTLFRFATAGSVDDGKSTLVGRLLHDSKAILADTLDAVARTSADRGFGGEKGGIDLALLTDGLRAEREQGITIDVALTRGRVCWSRPAGTCPCCSCCAWRT